MAERKLGKKPHLLSSSSSDTTAACSTSLCAAQYRSRRRRILSECEEAALRKQRKQLGSPTPAARASAQAEQPRHEPYLSRSTAEDEASFWSSAESFVTLTLWNASAGAPDAQRHAGLAVMSSVSLTLGTDGPGTLWTDELLRLSEVVCVAWLFDPLCSSSDEQGRGSLHSGDAERSRFVRSPAVFL